MKIDLSVNIAGVKLKNPVMNASGTFGFGIGSAKIESPESLGAIVTKTITTKPRKGNPMPAIIKIDGGIMNSVGLANVGIDNFIDEELGKYLEFGPKIFVSIAGESIEDFVSLAQKLDGVDGVSALEINTSCPNIHGGNIPFGTGRKVIGELVSRVRVTTNLPLIVKLTPNVEKIEPLVKACEESGADIISLINTLLGLEVDVKNKKPVLGGVTGGVSGTAVKNHALLRVWQARKVTKLPIIGMGGISSVEDAIKFIMVGATAVAVGTANYANSNAISEIIDGLGDYLIKNKLRSIADIKASL